MHVPKKNSLKLIEYKSKLEDKNTNLYIKLFDIDNHGDVKNEIKNIFNYFKRLDILVNCAGIAHGSIFNMTTIQDLNLVINTNFISQIYITQLCSRYMSRNKSGSIVNVSSISSFQSNEGTLAYGSSKAALNFATKVIARELAPFNIRVNAVAPGVTETDMLNKMDKKSIDQQINISSLKKVAKTFEIASVIAFLSSENSSHITGQIIKVDGGV